MAKVLIYNWSPLRDKQRIGGGVGVYVDNIIDHLGSEHQISFLNSGMTYNLLRSKSYVKKKEVSNITCYEIVNSPIASPASMSFHNESIFNECQETQENWKIIIEDIPGLEVVHFNNLEGVTVNILKYLKENFPYVKIVYSLHNYFFACPQVNLWNSRQTKCVDFEGGLGCVKCGEEFLNNPRRVALVFRGSQWAKYFKAVYKKFIKSRMKNSIGLQTHKAQFFFERRREFVRLLNQYCDLFLAVSGRTGEIAINYGLDSERVKVSYIGTRFYEKFQLSLKRQPKAKSNGLTIGFLGYARSDKGFFYFLNTLESLPAPYSQRVSVIFAGMIDPESRQKLNKTCRKFKSFKIYENYSHENIKDILDQVDVGIVAPIWEDNLPQITIEFLSHGVPILVSRNGGSKELITDQRFVFDTDKEDGLQEKIIDILEEKLNFDLFWDGVKMTSLKQHCDNLSLVYKEMH